MAAVEAVSPSLRPPSRGAVSATQADEAMIVNNCMMCVLRVRKTVMKEWRSVQCRWYCWKWKIDSFEQISRGNDMRSAQSDVQSEKFKSTSRELSLLCWSLTCYCFRYSIFINALMEGVGRMRWWRFEWRLSLPEELDEGGSNDDYRCAGWWSSNDSDDMLVCSYTLLQLPFLSLHRCHHHVDRWKWMEQSKEAKVQLSSFLFTRR